MPALAKVAPAPQPAPAAPRAVALPKPVVAPRSEALRTAVPAVPAFVRPALEVQLSGKPSPAVPISDVKETALPPRTLPAPAAPATVGVSAASHVPLRASPIKSAMRLEPAKPRPAALGVAKTPRQGGGQSLPPHIQEAIETSLMVDLSSVRLHASSAAQRKAQSLGARAFTFGNDIYLGDGEHPTDLTLISHEAAHVIQQQSVAAVHAWSPDRSDRFEHEADEAARAVSRGERFNVRERVESPRVQRLGISDALNFIAHAAYNIPGFRMFTIVLGVNPVNMEPVDRSPANVLRAVVEFIPGGAQITQALDKYGIFDKVGGWMQLKIDELGMVGSSIKKSLMDFLDSLSWTDIFKLDDVWERAKRIFTDPVDRIKRFVAGTLEDIWKFVRDAILKPLASLADGTAGWPLLTAVLGKNPITGEEVPRTAENLVGGFMKLIHEDELWANIQKAKALERCWAWFQGAMGALTGFVNQIPALFTQALKSLDWTDVINLPQGFRKVAGIFGGFLGSFISWAGNAVWELLQIIFEAVAPAVMPYLKKVGAAFRKILKAPIEFVKHLVDAAMLGLDNFATNFAEHLKRSLIDWLVGALPGVYIPKALSLLEFGKFALSVLGVSWAQIRAKIVKALGPNGEMIMKGLETAFDVVVALVTGGPAAAWDVIQDKLTNLKDMVIDGIVGFVTDTIIKKAIPKLISLFIPGAGFISAIVSIYDTIMVFVNKLAKIAAVVKSFVDSIVNIANGQIEGAAKRVETALEGILSLVISFLAGFLGLGDIASKVLAVIEKVRAMVDKALDTAINWIVEKAKSLWKSAKGAVQSVLDWWRMKQPFKADDGSSHTLLFKGEDESAQLVFETTPTQLESFLSSLPNPTPDQAKLISAISTDIALINKIRTFKKKDPTDAEKAIIQKNRDDVASGMQRISGNLGKLIGGKDWGTESKPLPLSYPKPAIGSYISLYFGPRTSVPIPQSEMREAQSDNAKRLALAAKIKSADASAEKNWQGRGYRIEAYGPASTKPLPESGARIGVTGLHQTAVGTKIKMPKTAQSTPGGELINNELRKYGYDRALEHTDGDHVLEIQLGGINDFGNMWPLESRMNQQAGSRISKQEIPKPDGTTIKMSDLKTEASKRDVWLVIVQTEG